MFLCNPARLLSASFFYLLLLSGCAGTQPAQVVDSVGEAGGSCYQLPRWLQLYEQATQLPPVPARAALADLGKPVNADDYYRAGLLYQQLQTYPGWMQARDYFRHVQQDMTLPAPQRQLAALLQAYNQDKINAHQLDTSLGKHNTRLQQQLQSAESEINLLKQKIQALTALEKTISTRKEQ